MKKIMDPNKRGIALITVICLLAMLIILAVTFSVAMRTERIAGRTDLDLSKARQLTHAALARAFDDVGRSLDNGSTVFYMFPPWTNMFTSNGTYVSDTLIGSNALAYIPTELKNSVISNTNKVKWVDFTNNANQVVGRFSYWVVNVSGYADANMIDQTNRNQGASGKEIYTDGLAPLPTSATLKGNLANYGVFETPKEWAASVNLVNASLFRPYGPPTNTAPYRPNQNVTNLFMLDKMFSLPLPAADLKELTNRLVLAGVPTTNVMWVVTNLVDYADSDDVPATTEGPCGEAVPMINEIVASNDVQWVATATKTSLVHTTSLTVEVWRPVGNLGATLQTTAPTVTIPVPPGSLGGWGNTTPVSNTFATTPTLTLKFAANGFAVTNYYVKQTLPYSGKTPPASVVAAVTFQDLYLNHPTLGGKIDHVPLKSFPAFSLTASNPKKENRVSYGVNDPRINWRVSDWSKETTATISLGKLNFTTSGGYFPYPTVEGTNIAVRNGPLQNAAELGSLSLGIPWQTIRLYSNANGNAHRVLDYFGVSSQTNFSQKGLINLNTRSLVTAESAFNSTPVRMDPANLLTISTLTTADALSIAQKLMTFTTIASNQNRLSVIGEAASTFLNSKTWQDTQRESVIANSYRLLSPRQNLFLVFVSAQSANDANKDNKIQNNEITAQQNAVALIWRDPYPPDPSQPTNTKHPSFVRFFKWLEE